MEAVLRYCMLLPLGHRRAMKSCATAGAVPGLGEPGGPTPSSPLPFTHIHMVTDAAAEPKAGIATHSYLSTGA